MLDINFALLSRIGLNPYLASQAAQLSAAIPGAALLRITEVHREHLSCTDGSKSIQAHALPRLLKQLHEHDYSLAVGDWVLAEVKADGAFWLAERLEPATTLSRRTSDGRRQALASNVDTALLVMGLDLDFNPRRMERYIAVALAGGVVPLVVLTKRDLAPDAEQRMELLRQRLPATMPIVALNALDSAAASALAPWMQAGQTLVMLGSSGAGKSTLTNTLTASAQATGAVRAGDGRGRHTTSARSLHLCAQGACIIDTPGLRSWQPDLDSEQLAAVFDDIDALAGTCQFRDCRHQGEPGCAVAGAVDADRLLNFHKMMRDAKRSEQTALERIAERQKWKVLIKSVKARR